MARREQIVEVPVVVAVPSVGPVALLFGAGVLVAVLVAIVVSCAHFGPGPSVVPPAPGDCAPFCAAASTVPVGGAR
jgi:hypothetical protein